MPARRMACTLGCAGARRQGGAASTSAGGCAGRRYNCREMGDLQTAGCRVLDGVVVGKAIRDDLAGRVVRVQQALGRPPALGIVLVGDGSGVRGLRPQQGPDRRRVRPDGRPDPPAGDRLARGRPRRGAAPERQPRARRHPGAVAAAGGARAPHAEMTRVRDHRSGQGRRRLQPGQRRAAGAEPRHAALVHAGRRDGDAAPLGHPGGRPPRRRDRPQRHRRQADGADAAARQRHRHDLPFADRRPAARRRATADILVVAIGRAGFVTPAFVKPGATVDRRRHEHASTTRRRSRPGSRRTRRGTPSSRRRARCWSATSHPARRRGRRRADAGARAASGR